jgi:adenine phosphoribosyltransferase
MAWIQLACSSQEGTPRVSNYCPSRFQIFILILRRRVTVPETSSIEQSPLRALALIRDIPDFPKPGILFKDITPVLADPEALSELIDIQSTQAREFGAELIVGIESRGFLFGVPIAYKLGLGFSPVRKLGKLPHTTIQQEYALEYGTNVVEMHIDSIQPGQRVVIVDDLLATGGTAAAAAALVEELGGVVAGYCFLIELSFLNGRDRLQGRSIASLVTY